MSDSDVYLPYGGFTKTCDTSYSSNKEKVEVASTVQSRKYFQNAIMIFLNVIKVTIMRL